MPPRRSTRTQAKEEDKKKKKKEEEEEDEEESEEEEKPKGKKGAAKKAPAKGKGKGKKKEESEDEEESEDDAPKKKGRAASKSKAKPGKRGKKQEESESEEEPVSKKSKDNDGKLKKVVSKGGAAVVDEHFDIDGCSVYVRGNTVYAKTLNQSNLSKNANKFYIIQLLKSDGKDGTFYTFNRWGRVGYKGQMSSFEFDDEDDAINDFNKKLNEKKKRGYVEVDINYDDEDEDDKPKAKAEKKGAKKVVKGKGKKDDDEDEDEEEDDDAMEEESEEEEKKDDKKKGDKKDEEKMVKLITKGGVAVDQFFEEKDCHVYVGGGKVYAKTLNQSNLNRNNNKFYIIQLLESEKNKGTFFTWNRWGRVGQKGQTVKKKFDKLDKAIEDFQKKFYDKTVKGDYVEVEINYDDGEEEETKEDDDEEKKEKDEGKSELPPTVKNLIKLIFDLNMMNDQMKEIGYDPKRMPLGKLSKNAIQKGYDILKQIADAIEKKKSKTAISDLCSQFFSYIPHDFGFRQMSEFIIDTDKKVKDKLEMLASLEEIQIATKLLSENKGEDNVLDANYKKLKCDLKPIEKNSDEWKFIAEYVKNTHASTHNQYGLEIEDLFATAREGEEERYTKNIHNKQLLWHGSRLTNYVGILSQGLRIAPPEAPVTGYMFGKGVYFADMVSKSANYCFTNPTNNTGLMLLCEVALGECNEKFHADYNAANLPPGKHSTKGVGKTQPAPGHVHKMDGDVIVPLGKGENSTNPNTVLLYNEFIVYDIKQIKLRYLLRMKFNYRNRY